MTAHKRRRRWLHVEPVETIRPFRPGPPKRAARLAEVKFWRGSTLEARIHPPEYMWVRHNGGPWIREPHSPP